MFLRFISPAEAAKQGHFFSSLAKIWISNIWFTTLKFKKKKAKLKESRKAKETNYTSVLIHIQMSDRQ